MKTFNLKSLQPDIITKAEIKLVTKSTDMSFDDDKTHVLWKSFGPQIKNISNVASKDKYSIHIYPNANFFTPFKSNKVFKKYAGVEVSEYTALEKDLQELVIPSGLYAIFHYIGRPSEANETFRYIFYEWLPASKYLMDNRPQIALMGDKYKGEHQDTEEEFWIPIIESQKQHTIHEQ